MELLELVTNLQTVLKIDDLKDMPDTCLSISCRRFTSTTQPTAKSSNRISRLRAWRGSYLQ